MNVDLVPQALDVLERAMRGQVGYGSLDIVRGEVQRLRGMEHYVNELGTRFAVRGSDYSCGWLDAQHYVLHGALPDGGSA